MGKERDQKKFLVWLLGNYVAGLKLLLTTLLLLCSFATFLQFITSPFTISTSDLRMCISRVSQVVTATLPPPPPRPPQEQVLQNGILKRVFNPYGSAAYNFITMGAYRGGLNTFAIVGISSKPLQLYSNPTYKCHWEPNERTNLSTKPISTVGYKILPDWGYGRVYTVVVVNCTFSESLNSDNKGGKLILYASTSGGGNTNLNITDKFEVLTEKPNTLDVSVFTSKPKYDYIYCGSSLYGDLNPHRVREWIAYHVNFFGPRSHFVIHDAGGVHEKVLKVLKPWMDLGYVTLQDIRDQERFDGYYHNQFMVVNDCLHRYKFMAKWMFFFDVDEYIYVPPKSNIKTVMDSLEDYNQITIQQLTMSSKVCQSDDYGKTHRKWGIEKLIYKDVKKGIRRDRKYGVQPRSLFATGVHLSQNLEGKTTHKTQGIIKYFHYHGTIAETKESCKMFVNSTQVTYQKNPYELDTTMRDIAGVIKNFERNMIRSKPT
ncbi:putative Glycosyltransferase family 92 [Lupinus albus]|uniref:Glycosyltransferase family 92 protein n=1 Tax=Lupinus albus TaxID=3870 RepID=A0A6A4PDQ6_LUPAL|nr:putative Glycosyltransferase family 92 [Lupinus albus]